MKKCITLFFIAFLFVYISNAQDEGRPAVWTDDPTVISYEPNKVLFKIIDEMAHIDMTYDSANGFLSESLPEFIEIVDEQEVVLIKRLFPAKNSGHINPNDPQIDLPHDLSTCYEIVYRKDTDAKELSEIISGIPLIEFAEPDYHCQMSVVPNDPGRTNQNYLDDVDAFSAWDLNTGDASQIIGIIDTGVDWDHIDLSGNIWSNSAEVNGEEGVDDDGNGYVDDIRGWDFVNDDANPNDDNSHGTHVAGIAAARTNNNIGMAGIAWNARIMPVKVLQSSGRGSWSDVAQGVAYCADNGATVINMSLGGYSESLTLKTALENAYYSSFPVAAAGNDFIGIHVADCGPRLPWPSPHFPACYSFVMGVQSSTGRFSNYDCSGPTRALNADGFNYEVSFPGSSIYSTLPNNRYGNFTGTSMASPIVAGAAALLKSYRTNISHDEMFSRLIACSGDIEYALSMSLAPNLVLFGFEVVDTLDGCDRDGVADAGETIYLNVTTKNFGGFAENITATLDLGEYEDPTVANITDGYSEMGNASSYARVNTDDNPFVIEIDENTANNRDIVLEVQFDCENSDQSFTYEFVITVQRGEELRGLMRGLTHLKAEKYYILTDNVVCDTLIIDPGVDLHWEGGKTLGIYYDLKCKGTPDSLINLMNNGSGYYGKINRFSVPGAEYRINMEYIYIVNASIYAITRGFKEIVNCYFSYDCISRILRTNQNIDEVFSKNVINNSTINHEIRGGKIYDNVMNSDYPNSVLFNTYIASICFNNTFLSKNKKCFHLNNLDNRRASQNYYGTIDSSKIELYIQDYFELGTGGIVTGDNALLEPPINAHGHTWKIEIEDIDAQDEYDLLDPMGSNDTKRFDVYFNRAMDTREQPFLSFGVREPYTQRLVSDSARWISWKRDESVGETIYQLQVSEDSTFETTVIDIDTIQSVTYYASGLDSTVNYFWRVRYKNDGDDWQKWSDVYNFRTHINQTDTPVLINPPDGSEDEYTKIMLRWEKGNFADSVHFQVSTSADFSTLMVNAFKLNMFVDSWELTNLDLSTEYFWRVRFHNQEGWGDFSDVWSFTTYTDSVKAPTLVYPLDGAEGLSSGYNYNKIEWNSVDYCYRYYYQASLVSDFSSLIENNNTTSPFGIIRNPGVTISDTIYCRVRHLYSSGVSSKWSEVREFYTIDHTNSVTPDLVSPEDGDIISIENGNPVLEWKSYNQRGYNIQVASNEDFNDPEIDNTQTTSHLEERTFTTAEIGSTYYWRVRTQAYEQPWSDWSEVRSFTIITDNEDPKPLLCVPSDNARGQKTDSLWLKWNNAPGANTVYDARWQAYYTFDYRTPQGLQTLRVANAFDNEYFEAPIEDWRFGFEVQTTSGASSNFVAEGGVERIDLEWDIPEDNNYIGFNLYRFVQINEEEFGDTVQVNQQLILDSTFTDFSVLPDSTYYYVYRVLQTNLQESDDSKIASATAISSTLLPPNLLFPPDDSTNMETTITLDWDEPSGAEEYVLQIATDEYYTNIILNEEGILSSNYTVQGLTNDQWYYWRVKAEGVQGTSLWSNIWAFHTKPRLPLQPTLVYPSDNANQIPTSVNLDWNQAQYATHYQLQVSLNNYFNNLIYDNDEITSTVQGISGLQQNVEYFWRVRGWNASGFGDWSVVRSFSTDTADYYAPPDNWDYTDETGLNAVIIVPAMLNIDIEGRDIAPGDAIGVFYRDGSEYKCGGYAIWTDENIAIVAWGDDDQTDEKDGFSEDEDFRFMVWDSRGGEEFYARVVISEGPDHFTENGITILDALYIPEMLTQDIGIDEGWNMISSNVHPEPDSIDWIMQPILDEMLLIRDNDGNMYFPDLDIYNLYIWEIEKGYKLYANSETILSIEGLEASPENLPFQLDEGWNMIGYPRNEASSVITMLEDIENDFLIIKDNEGNLYFPAFDINTLGEMQPGLGYLIYITNATTLTYPPNSQPRLAVKAEEITPRAGFIVPAINKTGSNMTLIIQTTGIPEGSEIGIWTTDNVLVGSGKVHEGKAAITIWGDNEQTKIADGAREYETLKAMVFERSSAKSYETVLKDIHSLRTKQDIENLQYQPEDIVLCRTAAQSTNITNEIQLICKPNPTTGETTIEYILPESGHVSLKLYTMTGQLISTITEAETTNGTHTITIDGSKLSSGVYNLQMIVEGVKLNRLLVVNR